MTAPADRDKNILTKSDFLEYATKEENQRNSTNNTLPLAGSMGRSALVVYVVFGIFLTTIPHVKAVAAGSANISDTGQETSLTTKHIHDPFLVLEQTTVSKSMKQMRVDALALVEKFKKVQSTLDVCSTKSHAELEQGFFAAIESACRECIKHLQFACKDNFRFRGMSLPVRHISKLKRDEDVTWFTKTIVEGGAAWPIFIDIEHDRGYELQLAAARSTDNLRLWLMILVFWIMPIVVYCICFWAVGLPFIADSFGLGDYVSDFGPKVSRDFRSTVFTTCSRLLTRLFLFFGIAFIDATSFRPTVGSHNHHMTHEDSRHDLHFVDIVMLPIDPTASLEGIAMMAMAAALQFLEKFWLDAAGMPAVVEVLHYKGFRRLVLLLGGDRVAPRVGNGVLASIVFLVTFGKHVRHVFFHFVVFHFAVVWMNSGLLHLSPSFTSSFWTPVVSNQPRVYSHIVSDDRSGNVDLADGLKTNEDSPPEDLNIFESKNHSIYEAMTVFLLQCLLFYYYNIGLLQNGTTMTDNALYFWLGGILVAEVLCMTIGSTKCSVGVPSDGYGQGGAVSKVCRQTMSIVANCFFMEWVILTLPLFLAHSQKPHDFFLNSFSVTFLFSLDDDAIKTHIIQKIIRRGGGTASQQTLDENVETGTAVAPEVAAANQ